MAYASSLAALGRCSLLKKQWSEAESVLREVLTIRQAKEPEAWTTFNAQSMPGKALLGRKDFLPTPSHYSVTATRE